MMRKSRQEILLSTFDLTDEQKNASLTRNKNVVVTAGAGSGKTRTLVARYALLLSEGYDLRNIIAITFNEKATNEMRSRVRDTLSQLASLAKYEDDQTFWGDLSGRMDSARISTFHSLYAEILRENPVEAQIDPLFQIVDEAEQDMLSNQIIEDTMHSVLTQSKYISLLSVYEIKDLKELFKFLFKKRLEVQEAFKKPFDPDKVVSTALSSLMGNYEICTAISELRSMSQREMLEDAGETLSTQVQDFLATWSDAVKALEQGNPVSCANFLFHARHDYLKKSSGKKGCETKELVSRLQELFDELLKPIYEIASDENLTTIRDAQLHHLETLSLVKEVFFLMLNSYKDNLRQRGLLDFDDLEEGAIRVLQNPFVRQKWQTQVGALLVDEFQDTNQLQRQVVEALTGDPGKLFVVGDAKQSIYRFRKADVSVFRNIRKDTELSQGSIIDLTETFRAHKALLEPMNEILRRIMGEKEDPSRFFFEPFQALKSNIKGPREGIKPPFIEFVLGFGDSASTARPAGARALATRLLELRKEGQFKEWSDVTLLFRAATGFPDYENAFEEADIPFITIAGKGFYERPEIRDVLNILRALANPTDDLAMAGLLRSPAFGLSDTALYQMRRVGKSKTSSFLTALQGNLSSLSEIDQLYAQRTLRILNELLPEVDRTPIAALLKKLINLTNYRAILASGRGSGRLWRNLDKLLIDAQASDQVNVRDFLDYLSIIRDAGTREGEAPAEVIGAVRLMTIHKAKGLEFPIVVLADASRSPSNSSDPALIYHESIVLETKPPSLISKLAKQQDDQEDDAEEQRILYVALTRAQQKLIINGHITKTSKKNNFSAGGWMKELLEVLKIDPDIAQQNAGEEQIIQIDADHSARLMVMPEEFDLMKAEPQEKEELQEPSNETPLFKSLTEATEQASIEESEIDEEQEPTLQGAVTGTSGEENFDSELGKIVGKMVHKAVELTRFPGDPLLAPLFETMAYNAGLSLQVQRETAINRAIILLKRFKSHPIADEIANATMCYHEVPYTNMVGERAVTGYIDLLYKNEAGWQILDFKSDTIQNDSQLTELTEKYSAQMKRYAKAVKEILGQSAQARICFLDAFGSLKLQDVQR